MLGSLHNAEDRDAGDHAPHLAPGSGHFEGRSSLRSWLYTITTNSSLRLIERRPKRVLPIEYGPPADPHEATGKPLVESIWVEPYPDERLPADDESASPEGALRAAREALSSPSHGGPPAPASRANAQR